MADESAGAVLDDKLGLLRGHYLIHLSEKVKTLEAAQRAALSGSFPEQTAQDIKTIAHQLAGGGGTYGFPTISEEALLLEKALADPATASPQHIASALARLLAACQEAIRLGLHSREAEAAALKDAALPLIAVVDDDPMLRLAYTIMFAGRARIAAGTSAHDALRLVMAPETPRLLILDDIMPGGPTGLAFLEEQGAALKEKGVPVIMVTASSASHDVLRGLKAGASDYITKPFAPEKLLASVDAILKRRKNAIAIALADTLLAQTLVQRLAALQCDARACPLSDPAGIAFAAQADIVLFDQEAAEPVLAFPRKNPAAALLWFGSKKTCPPMAEAPCTFIEDAAPEAIVRQIGLILAARKNKAGTPPQSSKKEETP